jgi:hydrogenase maturation protease
VKILVAGIGNIFLGDDGFGPAVAGALQGRTWPADAGVDVVDFGIRGIDLAYALVGDLDAAILVDAVARGGTPGTLYVIEPDAGGAPSIDTHAMDPVRVLAYATSFGKLPPVLRVVGCEPARLDDDGDIAVGLSRPVAAAVAPAADMVGTLVGQIVEGTCTS